MLWLIALLVAHADIPPPPGYVESCTVEKVQTADTECTGCAGYFGGREPCEALEAEGYAAVCQTRGASTWTEVMCRPKAGGELPADEPAPDPAPVVPEPAPASTDDPPPTTTRCDHLAPGGGGGLLALLLGALVTRRR